MKCVRFYFEACQAMIAFGRISFPSNGAPPFSPVPYGPLALWYEEAKPRGQNLAAEQKVCRPSVCM